MGKSRNINFANFICHFGTKYEMLDLAEEIIIPAFTSSLQREYGKTVYSFHDVKLLNLGTNLKPVAVLAGRHVKDTEVKREQILRDGTLVSDRKSMPSAPSAFFILVLNNHKLIYMPETRDPPLIEAFRVTAQNFVSIKHEEFVQSLHQKEIKINKKIKRNEIVERYPIPIIDVIPLASGTSLNNFIDQFDVLSEIRVRLIDPNNEINNNELFDGIQNSKDKVGAKTTELVHRNPKGMFKHGVVAELKKAVQHGNTEIKISGKDAHGDKLSGNNDRFKLSVPVSELPRTITDAAKKLYESFMSVIADGILSVAKPTKDPTEKIIKLLQQNSQNDDIQTR